MAEGDLTEMQQAAVMMHEMFLACCYAGFSEDQAITILIGMMNSNKPATFMPPPSNGHGTIN